MTSLPDFDKLRLLLLDLLSGARDVPPDAVARLTPTQWTAMLAMAKQHRLGPLLHWQMTQRHAALAVPDAVRAELKRAWIDSSRRQLGIQYELCAARNVLESAGIGSITLKGGFLAFLAYPNPALRPVRDLDILIPADRLVEAYRLLIANGAEPGETGGDPEALLDFALAVDEHHLPILTAASSLARIELHKHIQNLASVAGGARDAALIDQFWANKLRLSIAGVELDFPCATDMLLHLVMHAAYNHILNNGPLALADIAFLLRGHEVEWARFWPTAARVGATRGAVLLLDLAQHYWGALPVEWSADAATLLAGLDDMREDAALLMLQDRELGPEIWRRRGRRRTLGERIGRALHLLFLPRVEMAMIYPVKPNAPRILLYYPLRWWQLATDRLPGVVALRRRGDLRAQEKIDGRVSQWLKA